MHSYVTPPPSQAPLPLPVTISFWFVIMLAWWTVCPLTQRHNCVLRGTDDTRGRLITTLNSFLKDSCKVAIPPTVSKQESASQTMRCGRANTACTLRPNEKTLRSGWWDACQHPLNTNGLCQCVYVNSSSGFWSSWLMNLDFIKQFAICYY